MAPSPGYPFLDCFAREVYSQLQHVCLTLPPHLILQWQVHRVLRPEAYGGLVHNTLMKDVITSLPDSILKNTVSVWW